MTYDLKGWKCSLAHLLDSKNKLCQYFKHPATARSLKKLSLTKDEIDLIGLTLQPVVGLDIKKHPTTLHPQKHATSETLKVDISSLGICAMNIKQTLKALRAFTRNQLVFLH